VCFSFSLGVCLCVSVKALPARSLVLLHSCAQNPTGVDPSLEQWEKLAEVMNAKEHFALMDTAYQGFASGDPERDVAAVRLFAERVSNVAVCQSFAKNFGLYGERIGALHLVTKDAEETERGR
jgi:aspartate/tyrosine/aromatic aminotransferase